jgi:hypothetical protein
MCVSGKIIPVGTISGMGGDEFKHDIFDIL